MSKTLIVKYFYKNKLFSIKFSDGERNKSYLINKKITIGSDPNLFWQVFNTNFPKQFDLVVKEKDSYYINLLKSFSLEIKKSGGELDLNELKSLGILKNNRLLITQELSGKIIIDENTYYTFEFKDTTIVYSPTDKKNLALFSVRPKASLEQLVQRYSVIAVIILVAILYISFGWGYDPPKKLSRFEQIEREVQASMDVKASDKVESKVDEYTAQDMLSSTTETTSTEAEEVDDNAAKEEADALARADRRAKLEASGGPNTNVKFSRDEVLASSTTAGNSGDVGTGSNMSVKATLSGLGGSQRQIAFQNISSSTGGNLSELSDKYRRDTSALGAVMVSDDGASSSEIDYSKVQKIKADGSVNLGQVSHNLGDGRPSIEELKATEGDVVDIDERNINKRERIVVAKTDQQKKEQFERWFRDVIKPQIDNEVKKYQQKKPIKGQLLMSFLFENDILKNVNIRGIGSANDRTFISILRKKLTNQICPGIGNYRIDNKKHGIM